MVPSLAVNVTVTVQCDVMYYSLPLALSLPAAGGAARAQAAQWQW
jgi:hypothetical protein